tara:strand:- start:2718 stop:3716 length:999 start_codon:yes stop_codon:yes gene_type:complete
MTTIPFWKPPAAVLTPPSTKALLKHRPRDDTDISHQAASKRQALLKHRPRDDTDISAQAASTHQAVANPDALITTNAPKSCASKSWVAQIISDASTPVCSADDVSFYQMPHVFRVEAYAVRVQLCIKQHFGLPMQTFARGYLLLRSTLSKTSNRLAMNDGEDNINTRLFTLCAISCMVISCKFDSDRPLHIPDIVAMNTVMRYPILESDIVRMELQILFSGGSWQWDVDVVTRLNVVLVVFEAIRERAKQAGVKLHPLAESKAITLAAASFRETRLLQFSEGEVGVACAWCLSDEYSGAFVWSFLARECCSVLNEKVTTMVKIFAIGRDLNV